MNALTIAPVESLSVKAAASVFFASFGGLWLMVEPMDFFGVLPALTGWIGVLSYLGIFAFAIVAVVFSARIHTLIMRSKMTFVTFTVISATEGGEYLVRAPVSMQIWDFSYRFIEYLRKGPARDRVEWLSRYYDPVFQIEKSATVIDLDAGQTLAQAGITNGARCQLRGKPKEHRVMFSRGAIRDDAAR